MNKDAILNAAQIAAIRINESGIYVSPYDTVCAIESGSGVIYTGVSQIQANIFIHAEIDAVQKMLAAGERIVQAVLLIGTQTRFPLLPCNDSVRYILSIAAENTFCMVMLHDRVININEVGYFAMPSNGPQNYMGNSSQYPNQMNRQQFVAPNQAVSSNNIINNNISNSTISEKTEASTENASGDLLKSRVNSLLNVAKEPDTDEFLESLDHRKKRFGLFKK